MKIVTVEQMIDLEQKSAEVGAPPEILMEKAGLAVAQGASSFLGNIRNHSIVILVGPGNNGGDGLVAARHLHDWSAKVHLVLFKRKTENDKNFSLDMERAIPWTAISEETDIGVLDELLSSAHMVIDALFGTGKMRPLTGLVGRILQQVRLAKKARPLIKLVAVDLPSGLNADTGEVDPACVPADLTITLGYPKIGLFQFPGAAYLGKLSIADIGIPSDLAKGIDLELITASTVRRFLPSRPLDANKGTFGRLLAVAGSINYVGAAYLACAGAMRVGTGLVTLATPKDIYPILAGKCTEVTFLPLAEVEPGIIGPDAVPVVRERVLQYDALLLGCGLGQHSATADFVEKLLLSEPVAMPCLIDADGLNILAQIPNWHHRLQARAVLTPHPGEMSRLLGKPIAEIQRHRLEMAQLAAREWGQVVVLKGAHTVIASPQGGARISAVANPGLASAGTGDVLSGVIAGMLAQGLTPFDAAICGVHLHAQAGELVKAKLGDTGMLADDLPGELPLAIKSAVVASSYK